MHKKSILATIVVALSVLIILPAFASAAANLNPNKLLGAPSYVLNLVGKKDGWSGGGTYDNPDRHTIFVPQSTSDVPIGADTLPGLTIWMTQGEEFAVLDGNAFDEDADCDFQLGSGKYQVFIVALGKPGGGANVDGWIYNATDNTYLLNVGSVSVSGHSKTPRWENATDLLFVSPTEDIFDIVTEDTWIFDYLSDLDAWDETASDQTWLQAQARIPKFE